MKAIRNLIQRVHVHMEVSDLKAELYNIRSYGRYAELRAPRIVKRLAELGHPVRDTFADRHPQLAEDMRRAQELREHV